MIILDANVVSAAMRPQPQAAVVSWLNNQASETLYLSSVTLAELLFGLGVLPSGTARSAGPPLPTTDGYIAATAASHSFAGSTRNIQPFRGTGVDLIDPWHSRS